MCSLSTSDARPDRIGWQILTPNDMHSNDKGMPALASMNVSLTAELDAFVRERVAAGLYATSSEVVREGLRLLQQREREADESLAALRSQLQRGIEQADRGEFVDGDEVFREARELIERRQKPRASKAS